jgi:DNA-binding transcriptional ArsR family regulator
MRVRIAEYGEVLGTRSQAVDLRAKVEALITKTSDSLVILDLEGVIVFSISFGDQLFAELVERTQAGRYGARRWLAFAGANAFAVEQLEQVLKNAHLAALVMTDKRKAVLAGEIEPRVKQTFDLIERSGEATTGVLQNKLRSKSIQAVNNWLAKLVTARVVDREQVGRGSGRPYVYRSRAAQLVGAGGR